MHVSTWIRWHVSPYFWRFAVHSLTAGDSLGGDICVNNFYSLVVKLEGFYYLVVK